MSFPRYGAYAASKHAVEAVSDALRAELTPAGVSVSLIQVRGEVVGGWEGGGMGWDGVSLVHVLG